MQMQQSQLEVINVLFTYFAQPQKSYLISSAFPNVFTLHNLTTMAMIQSNCPTTLTNPYGENDEKYLSTNDSGREKQR